MSNIVVWGFILLSDAYNNIYLARTYVINMLHDIHVYNKRTLHYVRSTVIQSVNAESIKLLSCANRRTLIYNVVCTNRPYYVYNLLFVGANRHLYIIIIIYIIIYRPCTPLLYYTVCVCAKHDC